MCDFIKRSKIFLYVLFFFLITNCSSSKIDIMLLNGYWKINFVSQENEKFKFKGDTFLMDYYYLNNNSSGWRKKVKPLMNNNFETSDDTTFFEIKNLKTKSILFFETKWFEWKEVIVALDSVSLILKIEDKTYHYKRFNP